MPIQCGLSEALVSSKGEGPLSVYPDMQAQGQWGWLFMLGIPLSVTITPDGFTGICQFVDGSGDGNATCTVDSLNLI